MVDLALAFGFTAAFVAIVTPRFWSDAAKSTIAILSGFILASAMRDIMSTPAFPFDQQVAFIVGTASMLFALSFSSDNFPSLLVVLLLLWSVLEISALLFLQHDPSLQDYMSHKTIAYIPAMIISWTVVRALRIIRKREGIWWLHSAWAPMFWLQNYCSIQQELVWKLSRMIMRNAAVSRRLPYQVLDARGN